MHQFLRKSTWCQWRYFREKLRCNLNTVAASCHSSGYHGYGTPQAPLTTSVRHQSGRAPPRVWTAADVRQTFLDYFLDRDHIYVHSSSVVPRKQEGSYFVNAGMNQFKPVFLGTVDPDSEMAHYRRVVNSQKCIRVGGKHNDLDDVGRDTYHHTFFEMLGSWSFGSYFKEKACRLAWTLMTEVYGLPTDKLYVTYFAGDEALGLEADIECRDIWRSLGIKSSHIVVCGKADNFWDMGDIGPCGPCTEIHYDRSGRPDAAQLVNTGDPAVIELWNLVFMQYDRQRDGSLRHLPSHHVDTGMGLERLSAVLQNMGSNYDTDLFTPLFTALHKLSDAPPYGGRLGTDHVSRVDTAYRIVADHIRMVTVAMADGMRPGRSNVDSKLRVVLDQCIHQSAHVLKLSRGKLSQLVPVVADSLGTAFPEICKDVNSLMDVVNESEERYLGMYRTGTKLVRRLIENNHQGKAYLSASSLRDLQDGKWGVSVPADMAITIARQLRVTNVDIDGFNAIMELRKEKQKQPLSHIDVSMFLGNKLQQHDIVYLESVGIASTEDHYKYRYSWSDSTELCQSDFDEPCKLVAVRTQAEFGETAANGELCGLVFDRSPFYAEAGGQAADTGKWLGREGVFDVIDVQQTQGYVLHTGRVVEGELAVGDVLRPEVNLSSRSRCAVNHTATHLMNFALTQILGGVIQQGSSVTENKLVFDFTCSKTRVKAAELKKVTSIVREIIHCGMPVYIQEMPLAEAKCIPGLKMLQNEVYPSVVRVLSVGVPGKDLLAADKTIANSVELCGGTHVDNTRRIGDVVVTHFQGMQQGTKKITVITGTAAKQAQQNVNTVETLFKDLEKAMNAPNTQDLWTKKQHKIESLLTGAEASVLPKVERDDFVSRIDQLKMKGLNKQKNKEQLLPYIKEIRNVLDSNPDAKYVVTTLHGTPLLKQMVTALSAIRPTIPVLLVADVPRDMKQSLFNKTRNKKGNAMKLGIAYTPDMQSLDLTRRHLAKASSWVGHLRSFGKVKNLPIGPAEGSHKLGQNTQIYFLTFRVDDLFPEEHYLQLAKTYMEHIL